MVKASVTVFLSLLMTVMISLILTSLLSVQIAADRTALANCADQAMFSLFAQYDRDLLSRYHLFAIDAGRNAEGMHLGACYDFLQDAAEEVLHPSLIGSADSFGLTGRTNLTRLTLTGGSLDGYTLISDGDGAVFAEEAVAYQSDRYGLSLLPFSFGELSAYASQAEEFEASGKAYSDQFDAALDTWSIPDLPGGTGPEGEEIDTELPVEEFRKVRRLSILRLVTTDPDSVSGAVAPLDRFPSKRTLKKGMGLLSYTSSPSFFDQLLFQEYLLSHFPNYRDPSDTGLAYQCEYLIAGKDNDIANLTSVAHKLLLIRAGANYIYLSTDPTKRSVVTEAATLISFLLFAPELIPILENLLLTGWAYCESIIDVRGLLDGDRVPFLKSSASWQLPFHAIPGFTSRLDSFRKHGQGGLSYEDYLRIFLLTTSQTKKQLRSLDMMEYTIRKSGRAPFRIDHCLVSLTASFTGLAEERMRFTTTLTYDYRSL